MKIVVIGGSGLIGSKLVTRLREQSHQVLPASPNTEGHASTADEVLRFFDAERLVPAPRTPVPDDVSPEIDDASKPE